MLPPEPNTGAQRNMMANPVSSVGVRSGLTETLPGIRPDLSPEKTGRSGQCA